MLLGFVCALSTPRRSVRPLQGLCPVAIVILMEIDSV